MLKFFFFILLLANGGLLAYQQGYFETLFPSGREPARIKNQINADKLKLEKPPEAEPAQTEAATPPASGAPVVPATPEAAPAAPVAPKPTPAAPPVPAPPAAPVAPATPSTPEPAPASAAPVQGARTVALDTMTPPARPVVLVCAEIGNFTAAEAKRFSARLAPLSLGPKVTQRQVQEVATHMVYIPPQGDKETAEKKAAELRHLGVEDFFIIQDNSSLRWGISLGVFKMEEAARAHLANLNQKGVRSARIGQRSVNTNLVAFRLRDLDAESRDALQRIRASFARQEMRNCEGA
ncbi:SPOR domain-containing protein [Noviherbaspirillum sp. CPCC 100848]|uniref:SPOR domain-containing protein n=1 Tax=Noviherbaspirillum album TaxID=3080276 RepID=A0ABU6JG37_9BURK|nr:SPOR domain-containing protein [Noviherbaspirillum sp. CPCC 100848]MEC4722630.1 SPOR domain-containing protein [Noviherbaspirillum sp. CPCC 100848]